MAIILNILTLTTTSGNFFYNNYSVEYFITLNRLILIKTAKNIVISINNNAFVYGLTNSIKLSNTKPSGTEPSGTEPSTARHGDKLIQRTLQLISTSLTVISTTTDRTQPFYLFPPMVCDSSTTIIPSEAATPLVLTLTILCYRTPR
jgi:hypothetical protein